MKRTIFTLVLVAAIILGLSLLPANKPSDVTAQSAPASSVGVGKKFISDNQILANLSDVIAPTAECATSFYPCTTCETEAEKRCNDAIAAGGNSCDCTRAEIDYCWANCRVCKFCSLQIFFYQDTGCP